MKRAIVAVALALACLPWPAWAQDGDVNRAVETITRSDVRAHIAVLAADSLRGRNTPSPGLDGAARYVAERFRAAGLRPAGEEESFIQEYSIYEIGIDTSVSHVAVEGGGALRVGIDVAAVFGGFAPEPVSGPVLLVSDPASAMDAAGSESISEAVVVLVSGSTDGRLDPNARRALFGLYRAQPRAILVTVDYGDEGWAGVVEEPRTGISLDRTPEVGTPVLLVRHRALSTALGDAGHDLGGAVESMADRGFGPLTNARLTLRLASEVQAEHPAPNVVGVVEGRDPDLRDEYIVYTAHLDHIGASGDPLANCPEIEGDAICNGADDDASGVAAILELAEAFATLDPGPRRSLMFVTVSGEEKGLLGSRSFVEHPPVPTSDMVANLNLDMVGRNWSDTIVAIGRAHSDLGATLDTVAAAHPELEMTPIDDRWPEQRLYYRSDHYNFARKGVPVLFFTSFIHSDYHRPSDEVEKIDAEKEARLVRLLFHLGRTLANREEPPSWDPDSYRSIVEDPRP